MILLRDIKLQINKYDDDELYFLLKKKSQKVLRVKEDEILKLEIIKKSIDARNKSELLYNFVLLLKVKNENKVLKNAKCKKASIYDKKQYELPVASDKNIYERPVVIGAGPAGLFCSLILVEAGLCPIIIERGSKVDKRVRDVENFWATNNLNLNSNIQFGEGGAGTFSDGKLNTLVKDKFGRNRFVLEKFVEFGANDEILFESKPHIGTDILQNVIVNMRNYIIDKGGEFWFDTKLEKINISNNSIKSIELSGNHSGVIEVSHVCLAIGHSARDTFEMLYNNNVEMRAKEFSVGLRIEHLQESINESQYGNDYLDKYDFLPPCSYKLTNNLNNGRGVFSFCMCPGGYVINASSEENKLAINGMSNRNRDSKNANSAIIVTVGAKEFDMSNPLSGIEYQRILEKKAYEIGKGQIPVQLFVDFKNNTISNKFGEIKPTNKCKYSFANLRELFSDDINESIITSIDYFGRKIKGFNNNDALLSGVESRTSSPIRINRNEHLESNYLGLFPCGEGAGYAGGIMSAAMDGIKVAEAMIERLKHD